MTYSHIVSFFILANTQRKGNPKMSIVYHGAPTYIYICDTLPLDNPKTHLHTALPYITRGSGIFCMLPLCGRGHIT